MNRINFIKTAIFAGLYPKLLFSNPEKKKELYNKNGVWPLRELNKILDGIKSKNYYSVKFINFLPDFNIKERNYFKYDLKYYTDNFEKEFINLIKITNQSHKIIYLYSENENTNLKVCINDKLNSDYSIIDFCNYYQSIKLEGINFNSHYITVMLKKYAISRIKKKLVIFAEMNVFTDKMTFTIPIRYLPLTNIIF